MKAAEFILNEQQIRTVEDSYVHKIYSLHCLEFYSEQSMQATSQWTD